MRKNTIKKVVKERYGKIAKQNSSCCGSSESCCGTVNTVDISKKIGYSADELKAVPKDANLGLGCGNPLAFALIKPGQTVLDLGSGAGLDSFLAAKKVGKKGNVIGVDMAQEMIAKARVNAKKGNYKNVEFRLGEIENLPVIDNAVDLIISNCVINLSPDKKKVFKEAFRVLKPGGRLMVSDIVLEKELPAVIKNSIEAYIGCVAGAMLKNKYLDAIKKAGFNDVKIMEETSFPLDPAPISIGGKSGKQNIKVNQHNFENRGGVNCVINDPNAKAIVSKLTAGNVKKLVNSVASVKVSAVKPR